MKLGQEFRKAFFIFAVKKPYAVILSIILTFTVVLCIAGSFDTNIYISTKGVLTCNIKDKSDIYIAAKISDKFKNAIGANHYAIWYSKTDGKRYYGTLREIQDIKFSNYVLLKVVPSKQDMWEELGSDFMSYNGPINLEIHFKSKNILEKILANIL